MKRFYCQFETSRVLQSGGERQKLLGASNSLCARRFIGRSGSGRSHLELTLDKEVCYEQ